MPHIQTNPIIPGKFRQVRFHRNNYFYDFLRNVCYIINDNLLINEKEGAFKFRDFDRDESRMPYLFEAFVRNFCRLEQSHYKVSRERISWKLSAADARHYQYLPKWKQTSP